MQIRPRLNAGTDRIPSRPSAGRILQRAHVVEGAAIRIVIGVLPYGLQLGGTDALGNAAVGDVDPGTVVAAAVGIGVRGQTVRAGNVVDLLIGFAILFPALDDLQSL